MLVGGGRAWESTDNKYFLSKLWKVLCWDYKWNDITVPWCRKLSKKWVSGLMWDNK